MVQLKIILDTRRQKSDGTYPIMFRVTNIKQVNYISFGVSISEDHWDEGNRCISSAHPNAKSLNISLSKKFYDIQKAILTLEDNESFSISLLRNALHPQQKREVIKKEIKFLEFSKKLIGELMAEQRIGNALVYQTSVNRFMSFCDNRDIKFEEINFEMLESFKRKLTNEGVKINTIGNYLRTIRAIYNKAIKVKVADRNLYPFSEIHIKVARTAKRALSLQELKRLVNLSLPKNSKLWHARNYFLLSFYLIGISFTDLGYLQPKNIIRGRVVFKRRKTHKEYSIELLPAAQEILDYYIKIDNKYLLPILPSKFQENSIEAQKVIHQWIKTTNKFLKRLGADLRLESPLTTYVARHSWATIAKKLGYSNEVIAEALGHEYGNSITNIYLDKFDREVVDELNCLISNKLIN